MTLAEATELLQKAGVPDAAYDARTIFEVVGGVPRLRLVAGDTEADSLTEAAVKRRAAREPLQYILGTVDFYRESYEVTPDCLIPRQETELLVDLAVRLMPKGETFLDLCTGSGCIAVSTLKNTKDTRAVALDVSEAALRIAERNAVRNAVDARIRFILADALKSAVDGDFYAVLSNPPYVTADAFSELQPEIAHEPKIAFLGGGDDGADFYRRITFLYKDKIKAGGFILFEIGFDQGNILRSVAEENGMKCEIFKDYSALDRLALLRRA